MEEIKTKYCKCCKRELPITEFGKNAAAKDGLQTYCKECHRCKVKESYRKQRSDAIDNATKEKDMLKVYTNADLAKFTPRELMAELNARGFQWEYMLEPQRKIMFSKI